MSLSSNITFAVSYLTRCPSIFNFQYTHIKKIIIIILLYNVFMCYGLRRLLLLVPPLFLHYHLFGYELETIKDSLT